jgi:nucleotide-binding universal stress UspA family protein
MTSLRRTFDVEAAGLRTDWRSDFGTPADFLAEQARSADLIIVEGAGQRRKDPQFELDAADLLMTAGRPILFIPPQMERLIADKVVVGWKAGRHARVTLQQALPLLIPASEVTVVGIGPESNQAELDDVAGYLQAHGVAAHGQWQGANGGSPSQALVAAAVIGSADLIVTGGFGRGRLREWVLGGVTKDLLAGSPAACLMAH